MNKDVRGYSKRLLLVAACALGLGCDAGDPDAGGGTDTDGSLPQPELEGVRVECCFVVTDQNAFSGVGCTTETDSPCVDPSDPAVDLDGDGMLSGPEATAVCSMKAPVLINCPFDPFDGPGLHEPGSPFPVDPQGPYCGFVTNGGAVNEDYGSCNPMLPGQLDPFPNTITPPTHEGTLSASSSQVDVDIDGVEYALKFGGELSFALTDCSEVGRQRVCHLDLTALGLELQSAPTYGNYLVESVSLDLSMRASTSVAFLCDSTGCSGGFDYASRTGTDLQMKLEWEQKNLSSGAAGGGALALGRDGLASMSRVIGELDFDTTMSVGTFRLIGSGEDHLGGETATATFDVAGSVSKL